MDGSTKVESEPFRNKELAQWAIRLWWLPLVVVVLSWCAALVLYLVLRHNDRQSASELGAFGDWFGAFNALLSGLSVAGVAAALLLQVHEMRQQRHAEEEENVHRRELRQQQMTAAKAQAYGSMKDTVMRANAMAMQSPEYLDVAMKLLYPEDVPDPTGRGLQSARPERRPVDAKKRWIAFNLLNSAESAWFYSELGLDHGEAVKVLYEHHIQRLLRDIDVMETLKVGGYSPEFVAWCRSQHRPFDEYMKAAEAVATQSS